MRGVKSQYTGKGGMAFLVTNKDDAQIQIGKLKVNARLASWKWPFAQMTIFCQS